MQIDQRSTEQGRRLYGNPQDDGMIGKAHHAHSTEKKQHAAMEDLFILHLGFAHITDRIRRNAEKDKRGEQQDQKPDRLGGKKTLGVNRQFLEPRHDRQLEMKERGNQQ